MIKNMKLNNILALEQYLEKKPLTIRPAKWIFITVFSLVYLLSGLITMLDIIPYRMGLVSFFITPLFLLYGLKIDKVFLSYMLLTILIGLSAIYNNSPITQLLLFLRILMFSYLIYFLVRIFVNNKNIENLIKIAVLIGLLQLPVVIFQINTYGLLPARITQGLNLVAIDYDFGTFNFKGDSSMAFFILILLTYLLFEQKRTHFIRYRGFVILWFTLTILIANSEITKILLVIVWGTFFLSRLNQPITLYLFLGLLVIMTGLGIAGILFELIESVARPLQNPIDVFILGEGVDARINIYLNGGYSRAGAIYYYTTIEQPLWFGDGPSIYSDVFSKEKFRGNVGHIFTFYSEVGILASFMSYYIFFLIMFPFRGWKIRLSLSRVLLFISVVIMSFTTQIMNDIGIMLSYCIIAKMHLLDTNEYRF